MFYTVVSNAVIKGLFISVTKNCLLPDTFYGAPDVVVNSLEHSYVSMFGTFCKYRVVVLVLLVIGRELGREKWRIVKIQNTYIGQVAWFFFRCTITSGSTEQVPRFHLDVNTAVTSDVRFECEEVLNSNAASYDERHLGGN